MSVLWEHRDEHTLYSVRQSGASIRLYSNGVFHSQWNPDRPFAGGVWDCLSLPVLYRPVDATRRILLLGVGGGAVIRQLQLLTDFDRLLAIEIDPLHLQVAADWFGVKDERVDLVQADAIQWLRNHDGEPFDLIIDDLFGHEQGEPVRASELTMHWVETLVGHLNPDGLLVVNCVDARELKRALPVMADAGLAHGYRWMLPAYENAIGVLCRRALQARDWSRRLEGVGAGAAMQRQARTIIRRPLRFWKT